MKNTNVEYLNVRVDVISKVGAYTAIVYAYLCYVAKTKIKDDKGYFTLDSMYATKALGMSRRQFLYCRDKLASLGLIEHSCGANQNCKPRYKLL